MEIRAVIDHKIRVVLDDLPDGVAHMLMEALTIPNVEKAAAKKQHVWGWERMPDYIALYELGEFNGQRELVMPRGFLKEFSDGMALMGLTVEWDDATRFEQTFFCDAVSEPRPWQIPAIAAILKHEQGIYKAPAGSGKTVTVLLAIRELGCKSLIIVNTKDILWQWQERVQDHLGYDAPIGQIGDNIFEVADGITIATAQTLHRRFDDLEAAGFFDEFGFVCLDECHHATAETYNRVLDRFSARFRVGVSATPDKTGDFALAQLVLGQIFHETRPKDVTSLLKPEVWKIPTKFGYGFRGTKSRWQRSNYPQMIDALIRDEDRNKLIVRQIVAHEGCHQLVISKRLEHLDIIESLLLDAGFNDPIVRITGQDKNDERQAAKALAETEPCLILSTLADEALDIPRLDRLHLTFPQKNSGLVTQQVGRVERVHPDKTDAIILDYCDLNVNVLQSQWRTRRLEVYMPRGYKITNMKEAAV